jgi:hypothetical protein
MGFGYDRLRHVVSIETENVEENETKKRNENDMIKMENTDGDVNPANRVRLFRKL